MRGINIRGMEDKSKDERYDNEIRYFYDVEKTMMREIRGEAYVKLGQNAHIGRKG